MSAEVDRRFRHGEIVDVTVVGLRVLAHDKFGLLVERRDGSTFSVQLDEQTVVTRVIPAEGEPEPGDVWRDVNETVWLAFEDFDEVSGSLTLMCSQDPHRFGSEMEPRRVNHLYGPLELVYRPDPPKPASAPCLDTDCGPDYVAGPDVPVGA